jgi:hypothetical protein
MEWPRLREEVRRTAAKVGEQLRAFGDGGPPLSRVKWSAAEVGAHLVSLPRRYRRTVDTPLPFPDSVSADNQRELELIEERDPSRLADRLSAEIDDLLHEYGEEGSRPVYYYSVEHTVAGMHLSADPVVFLRNAYGLISNARAALTGGIVVYGRRPWLAVRFAKLFVET